MNTGTKGKREQFLRNRILDHYTSLRQFAIQNDIPYSSVLTMLERGIGGVSFDTVMHLCHVLAIDPTELYDKTTKDA